MADLHGQLVPVYFREPSVNIGAGEARGLPPHLTGREFLRKFGIAGRSAAAYALTAEDFAALARSYGRIGGLDRAATVIKSVRAERGLDRVLFLDGGDTWQGSLGALRTQGQDMVDCVKLLKPDAMTGHWEFTYGEKRLKELVGTLGFPFLALNVRDTEWQEPVFDAYKMFDKAGTRVAVLGQAFPYTPVANPRWMMPSWSFGIREDDVRATVAKARRDGAQLVVLLSHNGFDVDRKLAGRVADIDVILTSHTHDALPQVVKVGKTLLVASGSHGKFVSRLDLDVRGVEVKDFRYRLIPLFSDAIRPDPEMTAQIAKARAPFATELARVVGKSESLLYRRGNFNGTFDDLICAAIMEERDAEIALSPGFRWGTSVLPGAPITVEDIHNATAITYPQVYRVTMTGARAEGDPRGRGRQSVQSRSLLPAGRRHGALRRPRLRHRHPQGGGQPHRLDDPSQERQADRPRETLYGRRLGERERGDARAGRLGPGRALRGGQEKCSHPGESRGAGGWSVRRRPAGLAVLWTVCLLNVLPIE